MKTREMQSTDLWWQLSAANFNQLVIQSRASSLLTSVLYTVTRDRGAGGGGGHVPSSPIFLEL